MCAADGVWCAIGALTVRGTPFDAMFIGLWLDASGPSTPITYRPPTMKMTPTDTTRVPSGGKALVDAGFDGAAS